MKLRKQAPAKALIVVASAGLLFAFYGIVKAEPRIKAASSPMPVDYRGFFAPASSDAPPSTLPDTQAPHGRTRAS